MKRVAFIVAIFIFIFLPMWIFPDPMISQTQGINLHDALWLMVYVFSGMFIISWLSK